MIIEMDNCTNCNKQIDEEKSVKKAIDKTTFKFYSQACVEAYKETNNKKHEDVNDQYKRTLVLSLYPKREGARFSQRKYDGKNNCLILLLFCYLYCSCIKEVDICN